MKKITQLESLKFAVGAYEHDATHTKNPHRKSDYDAIKKLYDGLAYFTYEHEHRSCGAIMPFMKTAYEEVVRD
jgi:hypothetical protein